MILSTRVQGIEITSGGHRRFFLPFAFYFSWLSPATLENLHPHGAHDLFQTDKVTSSYGSRDSGELVEGGFRRKGYSVARGWKFSAIFTAYASTDIKKSYITPQS